MGGGSIVLYELQGPQSLPMLRLSRYPTYTSANGLRIIKARYQVVIEPEGYKLAVYLGTLLRACWDP